MLSLKGAKVYDMDAFPVHPVHWTDMANIRALYEFLCSLGMSLRITNDKLSSKNRY